MKPFGFFYLRLSRVEKNFWLVANFKGHKRGSEREKERGKVDGKVGLTFHLVKRASSGPRNEFGRSPVVSVPLQ